VKITNFGLKVKYTNLLFHQTV